MSLDVAKSLTRLKVGTKGNFCACYRRIRAPFLAIINELIPKINDMVISGSQRTSNKDERAALNEKCARRILRMCKGDDAKRRQRSMTLL